MTIIYGNGFMILLHEQYLWKAALEVLMSLSPSVRPQVENNLCWVAYMKMSMSVRRTG